GDALQRGAFEIIVVINGAAVFGAYRFFSIAFESDLLHFAGALVVAEQVQIVIAEEADNKRARAARDWSRGIGIAIGDAHPRPAVRIHAQSVKVVIAEVKLSIVAPAKPFAIGLAGTDRG